MPTETEHPELLRYGFAIAGVQKAGTSTLSQALGWHPHVLKAPKKEVRFFNRTDVDWSDPPYAEHVVRREKPQQRVVGDATPVYLWWPHALERMRDYNPDLRLVVVLRDPLERAFSQWVMERERRPGECLDWPELIRRHLHDPLPDRLPDDVSPARFGKERSAFSRGRYAAQVERGLAVFPAEQWLWLEFRAMLEDFPGTVDRVTDFIGIRRFRNPARLRHAMPGAPQVVGTPPTAADVAAVAARYADDLSRLPALTGLPVGHWPTAQVLAGTRDPAEVAARLATRVVEAGQGRA